MMMLSRLRYVAKSRCIAVSHRVAAESTSSEGGVRGRMTSFAKRVRAAAEKPAPNAPPASPAAPASGGNSAPGAAAATATPPQSPFDLRKLIRIGMMLLGASFFLKTNVMDTNNPNSFVNRMMNPKAKKNLVLKVERMDDTLAAYNASFVGASKGMKAAMLAQQREQTAKVLNVEISSLTDEQIQELLSAGKLYRAIMEQYTKELSRLRELQLQSVRLHGEYDDLAHLQQSQHAAESAGAAHSATAVTDNQVADSKTHLDKVENELRESTAKAIQDKIQVEVAFMRAIERILSTEQKSKLHLREKPDIVSKIKDALLGHEAGYEFIMDKLARVALLPSYKPHKVFVLTFKGDMQARQVELLRDEITAVLSLADPSRDQVVVQLNSGGGTVTGYGLGAAQLQRIKNAGLHLTVAIDEVAASGGYLMACVADRIVASPFALLGSVGVVATIPNFSERLQREGVAVEDVTAGKYKRTLTPYKKATAEDRAKVKSEVEDVLTLFKEFVKSNRPNLDLEKIATGETWYGPRAQALGLVDELKTVDELLQNLRSEGAEVYSLALKSVQPTLFGDNNEMSDGGSSLWTQVRDYFSYWLVQTVSSAVQQSLFGQQSPSSEQQLHLAVDTHNHPRL